MMSETHQTTETKSTTVTMSANTQRGVHPGIAFNVDYLKDIQGILKIIQLICGLIAMCCASPAYLGGTKFFMFVLSVCFIVTFLLLIAYITSIPNVFPNVPWMIVELIFTAGAVLMVVLAAIVQIIVIKSEYGKFTYYLYDTSHRDANYAAGAIGFILAVLYGVGGFLLFKAFRSSRSVSQ